MSYKDDIIEPLKQSGHWDRLPSERRRLYEELLDDHAVARAVASQIDEEEANLAWKRMALQNPTSEEAQRIAVEEAQKVAEEVAAAFRGRLVAKNGERFELSPLGRKLVEFVDTARSEGFTHQAVSESLGLLSPFTFVALQKFGLLNE
ncbi:MAG: hypothetical protein H0T47_18540 [Planctomycetaceae bacterium]|nr:hypothetical protein [Planctomycetaceae bacterium]